MKTALSGGLRGSLVLVALANVFPVVADPGHAAESRFVGLPAGPMDAMSPATREGIWREIEAGRARLALRKAGSRPGFQWPLRPAHGYSDPGYETIAAYVDHDPAYPDHLKDYNCGMRTYDDPTGYNHQGTDIALSPDSWAMMDARQVEIVAAAPGTIVYKSDGNFDRNCSKDMDFTWNAVYVQHDDGSIAWYGHMKSGSQTSKPVGSRVAAGEFLGDVGSSGNSTAPHLHFEVYDASNNLVDPFAGACNNFNSSSWWAAQGSYLRPKVIRVVAAGGEPVDPVCGSNGRLTNPGTINAIAGFAPGTRMRFLAFVRDLGTTDEVRITIRRPDGTVWDTFGVGTLDQVTPFGYFDVTDNLEASAPTGTWLIEASAAGTSAQASFAVNAAATPSTNYTDIWWNPSESGWGINLAHQGDTIFATWFTYDTDHSGLWLVMTAARQPDGSFAGTLYRTTGTALAQINGQPASIAPPTNVGSGTLRFATASQATFAYTVNGISQQKSISRQSFSTPTTCIATSATRAYATNYQDLWWNPSESGWGINVAHQGDILFSTWFTYAAGGRGQWLVGPDLVRQPTGEFTGSLYRTTGTPFNQVNGTPAVATAPSVGDITFTFTDGEHARMDYHVDGVSQSKSITRQAFATTTPLCH